MSTTAHCCRMCGATSFRRVIDRDAQGALRPTALYQCSGCSVVFADPKAWREGGVDLAPAPAPLDPPRKATLVSAGIPFSPDFSTSMQLPAGVHSQDRQRISPNDKPAT